MPLTCIVFGQCDSCSCSLVAWCIGNGQLIGIWSWCNGNTCILSCIEVRCCHTTISSQFCSISVVWIGCLLLDRDRSSRISSSTRHVNFSGSISVITDGNCWICSCSDLAPSAVSSFFKGNLFALISCSGVAENRFISAILTNCRCNRQITILILTNLWFLRFTTSTVDWITLVWVECVVIISICLVVVTSICQCYSGCDCSFWQDARNCNGCCWAIYSCSSTCYHLSICLEGYIDCTSIGWDIGDCDSLVVESCFFSQVICDTRFIRSHLDKKTKVLRLTIVIGYLDFFIDTTWFGCWWCLCVCPRRYYKLGSLNLAICIAILANVVSCISIGISSCPCC